MLTPRQAEIASMVARGWSSKAIALQTGLSVRTVDCHISAAAARLPVDGPPRYRLIVFSLSTEMDED